MGNVYVKTHRDCVFYPGSAQGTKHGEKTFQCFFEEINSRVYGSHMNFLSDSRFFFMTSSEFSLTSFVVDSLCQPSTCLFFFRESNKMVGSSSKMGTLQIEEFYRGFFYFLSPFFFWEGGNSFGNSYFFFPFPFLFPLPLFSHFFLSGKGLFVTGATGFVGKVLVEKILRSLPCVGKVSFSSFFD